MNIIEPAHTEWASLIVLEHKKDGSLHICVKYKKINSVIVRDSYRIHRMDEVIDFLGDAEVFITLDANCGYLKVAIDEQDRDKTNFTSHHGL